LLLWLLVAVKLLMHGVVEVFLMPIQSTWHYARTSNHCWVCWS
jgi:hypothetical protein